MAFDAFIQIDGIEGESTDQGHENWIEVDAYCLGAKQAVGGSVSTGGSLSSGRVELEPFVFSHVLDKASPKIQQACTQGKHIAKVKLEVCRSGGDKQVYYEVTMEKVLITRAEVVGVIGAQSTSNCVLPSNADLPSEEVELLPAKITWKYTETKKDGSKGGSIEASWDQGTNVGT